MMGMVWSPLGMVGMVSGCKIRFVWWRWSKVGGAIRQRMPPCCENRDSSLHRDMIHPVPQNCNF